MCAAAIFGVIPSRFFGSVLERRGVLFPLYRVSNDSNSQLSELLAFVEDAFDAWDQSPLRGVELGPFRDESHNAMAGGISHRPFA